VSQSHTVLKCSYQLCVVTPLVSTVEQRTSVWDLAVSVCVDWT